MRLRYPPGISSTTNADVRFTGTNASSTLSGELTVMKLAMTPGFDFGSYLERAKLSSPGPQASSPLNRIKLDLRVTTTPELQMQTAMAKLSGDADLKCAEPPRGQPFLGASTSLRAKYFSMGQSIVLNAETSFSQTPRASSLFSTSKQAPASVTTM